VSSAAVSSGTEAALLDQINSVMGRIDGKTTELQNSINGKLHCCPQGCKTGSYPAGTRSADS
jgi:hypothetical protein